MKDYTTEIINYINSNNTSTRYTKMLKQPEWLNFLLYKFPFVNEMNIKNIKMTTFMLRNNINEIPNCPICGKQLNFIERVGFPNTCSQPCRRKLDKQTGKMDEIINKARATYKERTGYDSTFSNPECREKCKETMLEKYGVDNPLKRDDFKEKRNKTNLERYGFKNSSQNKEVRDKAKKTNLERYGVEYVLQNKEIKEKMRKHNLEKYGVEYVLQYEEIIEKRNKTNLEKYGTKYSFLNEEVKEKGRQTNLEKYGVENVFKSKIFQKLAKNTMKEKYGYEHWSQVPEVKEQRKKAFFEILLERLEKIDVKPLFTIDEYKGAKKIHNWHCEICNNEFKDDINRGELPTCSHCYPIGTKPEIFIEQFLRTNNINYTSRDRTIIPPMEIDFYLPDYNLGIEFCGIYWHSDKFKNRDYHTIKMQRCNEKGIELIQIFEDERMDKLFRKILNRNKFVSNYYIEQIDYELADMFLNDKISKDNINYGLYSNNHLVSVISLKNNEIKAFESETNEIEAIKLFCEYIDMRLEIKIDCRWSQGEEFIQNGFKIIKTLKENVYYVNGSKRTKRSKYDSNKIYDSGFILLRQ